MRLTPLSLAFQMQVIGFPAGITEVALPRPGARTVFFFSLLNPLPFPLAEGCVSSRPSLKRLMLTIYLCKGLFLAAQLQLIQ